MDSYELISTETKVIPDNYVGHISVKSELVKSELCIEGGMRETGAMIPRCVITTDNDGKSILPILNITGSKATTGYWYVFRLSVRIASFLVWWLPMILRTYLQNFSPRN